MRVKTMNISTDPAPDGQAEGQPDGRRQRSERSKHKIAEAMIALIMDGDITPSAEAVAERAGVGLRSVFRHFKDMDSLFAEVSKIMRAEFEPQVFKGASDKDWQDQLQDMIQLRAKVLDKLMPMQQSSFIQRHRSSFVRSEVARTNKLLRQSMLAVLPKNLAKNAELVEALDATLSPATWIRLRQDQGLSQAKARKTLEHMVAALLKAAT